VFEFTKIIYRGIPDNNRQQANNQERKILSENASSSDNIAQLQLFSETASRVHDSAFVKDLKSRGKIGFTISGKKDRPVEVMKRWPEEDLVSGFLLPFRMLIQKNDPCSWRQICELVEDLDVPSKYKEAFREARINLNDYLDTASTTIKFQFTGAPKTRRELLYTFLYGYYAHVDPKCRKKLDQWKQIPLIFDMLEYEFINIIINVSDLSYRMSEQINKPMIEILRARATRALGGFV